MKNNPPPPLFILGLALLLGLLPALRAGEAPAVVSTAAAPVLENAAAEKAADGKSAVAEVDGNAAPVATDPAPDAKPRRHSENEKVGFGQDSTLAAGEQADAVVSIIGSSTSAGDVGDAIVSIIGNTRVTGGTVGDAAVAVLGSVYINGHVHDDVVAVLGNVELGPDAVVDGEVVCIGGEVKRDRQAVVHGNIQHIAIGGHHLNFDGLRTWFRECALYLRPLAVGEHLMWAWSLAFVFLGFCVLLALVVPGGVLKCVQTLEERPGKSMLAGVLALLLTPVTYVLLTLTLVVAIGFALIPLFTLGLLFAGLFGWSVMLVWLGRRVAKPFGAAQPVSPALAVLIGGAIVLVLFNVPVLGFIVHAVLGTLGFGVVFYTLILLQKDSRPAVPPLAVSSSAAGEGAVSPAVLAAAATAVPPPVISAATLPRAGFWIRLAALAIDLILMGMISGVFGYELHMRGPVTLPWIAIYGAIMWRLKGTTIGGIICGLRVVRLDDRPIDWSTAIVRMLGCFLSLVVAGLGFFWVVFDDEKQSWHDKIAGTTVVRVPKGVSLI